MSTIKIKEEPDYNNFECFSSEIKLENDVIKVEVKHEEENVDLRKVKLEIECQSGKKLFKKYNRIISFTPLS